MADESDAESMWNRSHKPLPLRRILAENGQNGRLKSPGKSASTSLSPSLCDKENVQTLTKVTEKRLTSSCCRSTKDIGDNCDNGCLDALSSTLAAQQSSLCTPERVPRSLFSASNLSSISLCVNASQCQSSPDSKFKTPKRRDDVVSAHTPSSESNGTRSSHGTRTPSSSSSVWSSSSGIRYNPFDSHATADRLHLPTVSPSVFATVTSPSNEETVNGQFWSIEQQAELYPTAISDDSPFKQSILHRNYRQESDSKAQEQIELYFSSYHDVTSPPDLPPTGPLIQKSPDEQNNASLDKTGNKSSNKWTQTCITLPPVLPGPVESVLRQYNFFTDITEDACTTNNANLSNSTLRRKLFNADMFSDDYEDRVDESQRCSSSDSETSDDHLLLSPSAMITTGMLIRTPVTNRGSGGGHGVGSSAQWSSSPVRSRLRTGGSLSSPDLHSPMFSPIAAARHKTVAKIDAIIEDPSVFSQDDSIFTHHGETEAETERETTGTEKDTSDLYKTAEIRDDSCVNMDTDSNSGTAWRPPSPSVGEDSSTTAWQGITLPTQDEDSSTAAWQGITLPTQGEDSNINTESRIDTGYSTNTVSSLQPSGLQDSGQPSSQVEMDSGVSNFSNSQQPDRLTVSLILPVAAAVSGGNGISAAVATAAAAAPTGQMPTAANPAAGPAGAVAVPSMSYAAECTNDISVGFPLGSSTPTK